MVDYNPDEGEFITETVPAGAAGRRLDAFLADRLPAQSRSFLRRLIDDGLVEVDGARPKASRRLEGGETVRLFLPELVDLVARPEPMDLDILHEDADIIVVNKPPRTVVHPSPGHEHGALVNGLLHHCGTLSDIGAPLRPGIVHRLDRDTSGVLIAARHDAAHEHLAAQFAERTTEKVYLALVHGAPEPPAGLVDARIGRHPRQPVLMAVVETGRARDARTDYATLETHGPFALVECRLHTGRTHQIRVHMAHIGCPILCDTYYGREQRITRAELLGRGAGQAAGKAASVLLDRQALHARRLGVHHPGTGERLVFEADLPFDMDRTLRELRKRER
ncbi:MAG: RluA family pseudouridine synthase [Planctomycetota bacterium]